MMPSRLLGPRNDSSAGDSYLVACISREQYIDKLAHDTFIHNELKNRPLTLAECYAYTNDIADQLEGK